MDASLFNYGCLWVERDIFSDIFWFVASTKP